MKVRAAASAALFGTSILFAAAACRSEQKAAAPLATTPGKVLTIRTSIPGERSFLYFIGVADGKVRLGSETDQWRLIDVRNRTVTFVDEINRTYRTVAMSVLLQERRSAVARRAPEFLRPATFEPIRETRTYAGLPSTGYAISMGAYRREIWLSYRSIIAPEFLSLYLASEPVGEAYAGSMREVYAELLRLQGFPVHERSEMPLGSKTLVIERTLIRAVDRPVPVVWFQIPPDFRDLTPAAAGSPAGRPTASSAPPGQRAPAAE